MNYNGIKTVLGGLVASVFISGNFRQESIINLTGMGGFAVSPDNSTMVVSLPSRTELVFIDTVACKEIRRVIVEFQPTQMVWSDNVLFVAQKSSGIVHIIDTNNGKELATGNASGPVRNLTTAKGVCFASNSNRQVFSIDKKGTSAETLAAGTFVAADPKGDYVYTVVEGRVTTDVMKYEVIGSQLKPTNPIFRSLRTSLINVQGIGISGDGKVFGVVAGGGWTDLEDKTHYSVPLYSTGDMKSQFGDLEVGPYPCAMVVHPILPLMFACNGNQGAVYNAKSYVPGQRISTPKTVFGAGAPSVLAFVGRGEKLVWGVSTADSGVLKFYDLQLTKDQQGELAKAFVRK